MRRRPGGYILRIPTVEFAGKLPTVGIVKLANQEIIMANSGLHGPFPLTADTIRAQVIHTQPGAYALGRVEGNTFHIARVGRSDDDVGDRLGDYVGQYDSFKFDYFSNATQAFEKECNLYHDFSPVDNVIHPDSPDGMSLECPKCNALG